MSRKVKNLAPVEADALTEAEMEELLGRVTINPRVCHGAPCIRDLRILVSTIADSLKGGMTSDDLLIRYPDLTEEDIVAAALFAKLK